MGKKSTKGNKVADTPSNVEPDTGNETLVTNRIAPQDTPVRVHIHSKRKRLVDADGISAKAAIDGIVEAGLLADDSPEFINEVTFSQEKIGSSEEEETIIEIYRYDEVEYV